MYEIKVLTTKLLKLVYISRKLIFPCLLAYLLACSTTCLLTMKWKLFHKFKSLNCLILYIVLFFRRLGQYSELNREPTVPHTVALPIELYYPYNNYYYYYFLINLWFNYTITISKRNLNIIYLYYFKLNHMVKLTTTYKLKKNSRFIKKIMLEWFEHSIVNTKNLWLTH